MSWSLELRGGDLTIDGAKLGRTTGAQKLVQDLRCALLEPRGFDDFHPTYGSLIDGGIDEYGVTVPGIIGSVDWEFAALRIQSEIRRVATEYQKQQATRARNDRSVLGESTLTNDELLLDISDIQMTQAQDRLMVRVTLRTATGQTIPVDIPLENLS